VRNKFLYIFLIAVMCAAIMLTSIIKTEVEDSKSISASISEDKITLIIDPGHGGIDGGAVGINGTVEKNVNLDISRKCSDLMDLIGIETIMTRYDDRSLHDDETASIAKKKVSDIKNRVKLINNTANSLLLSIHMNSYPDSKYSGAQVFYSVNNSDSEILAKRIQSSLRDGLSCENKREAKPSDGGIYILKNVNCPAVIVECGFLSNFEEEALLNDDNYKKKTAASICSGVAEYLYGSVV